MKIDNREEHVMNVLNKLEKVEFANNSKRGLFDVNLKYLPCFSVSEKLFNEICKSLKNEKTVKYIKDEIIDEYSREINTIIFTLLVKNFVINIIEKELNEDLIYSLNNFFESEKNNSDNLHFVRVFFESIESSGVVSYFNADGCLQDINLKSKLFQELIKNYIEKLAYHLEINSKFITPSYKDRFLQKMNVLFKNEVSKRFKINV